eukprot:169153_1
MTSNKQQVGTFNWKPMTVTRCVEDNHPHNVYPLLKLSMIDDTKQQIPTKKQKQKFNNRRNHKRNKHKQHKNKNGKYKHKHHINYNYHKLEKLLNPIIYTTIFNSNLWLKSFKLKKEANIGDWLLTDDGINDQNGQTFYQWYQNINDWSPTHLQNKIGLIPISNFDIKLKINKKCKNNNDNEIEYITLQKILCELIEIYFGMKVKNLYRINTKKVTQKVNKFTECLQLSSNDIIKKLYKEKKNEPDLFCLVGMSMVDLYPNDDMMNFVFGAASNGSKTGVFSFARYLPGFYDENKSECLKLILNGICFDDNNEMNWKDILSLKEQSLFIRRCSKVLTHEIGHIFGIEHCIHFECAMNGANHIGEVDDSPLYLCPLCLHKIYFSRIKNNENRMTFNKCEMNELNEEKNNDNDKKWKFKLFTFDLLKRYYLMQNWSEKYQLMDEYKWYKQRIELIENVLQLK